MTVRELSKEISVPPEGATLCDVELWKLHTSICILICRWCRHVNCLCERSPRGDTPLAYVAIEIVAYLFTTVDCARHSLEKVESR